MLRFGTKKYLTVKCNSLKVHHPPATNAVIQNEVHNRDDNEINLRINRRLIDALNTVCGFKTLTFNRQLNNYNQRSISTMLRLLYVIIKKPKSNVEMS